MRLYLLGIVTLTLAGCGHSAGNGIDAPNGSTDGNTYVTDGKVVTSTGITIIVEPNANHGTELVAAINAAHTSVYMTMYEIDDTAVINAPRRTQDRGPRRPGDPRQLHGRQDVQHGRVHRRSTTRTSRCVCSSSVFMYTHEKTVIIDSATAWIMTMNANTSSPTYNREYLAIDSEPADVAEATAVFAADHEKHAIAPIGDLVVANANARPLLVALIDSATKTLDVEGEEFSDTNSNGVVDAVVQAVHRGVTVHVIIGNATPDPTSIALVKNSGGHVVVTGPGLQAAEPRPIRTSTPRRSSSTAMPAPARVASSARRTSRPARSATTASSA